MSFVLQFTVLPLLAAILGFLYLASTAVYNVFFHPLRKYPGPILNKMTHMVLAYHITRGNPTRHVRDLHNTYGRVVRISPNELSYIDEQAWPDIYGHASSSTKVGNLPKDPSVMRQDLKGAINIIQADTANHRRLRRIQTHMFSEKVLLAQEPLLKTFIERLVACLHEKASNPSTEVVDLVKWYNYTTFDVLGELAFGESFHCLETDVLHPWIETIHLLLKDAAFWFASEKFPWPLNKLVYKMSPKETRYSRYRATNLVAEKVNERISQGSSDRVDFMSYILKHNDEKGMTLPEMESNAQLLVIAGSETTATFLSGVTYHLLCNPQHLAKLTDLIRTTFPSKEDITVHALKQLEYLSAVIDEGFRTFPPVALGLLRRTVAGGSLICGEVVPEYTTVSIAIFSANMSSQNWTDPEKFVPERWLKDEECPEKYRSDKKKVMNPFSMGPRNCIGRNLALAELRLILVYMLWSFDLELMPESTNWTDQKVYALWEKKPLRVRLTSRKL